MSDKMIENEKLIWRVVQTYLAKDDENDFRLFEPHVNPEAEHWLKVSEDLVRLDRMMDTNDGKQIWATGQNWIMSEIFKNKMVRSSW